MAAYLGPLRATANVAAPIGGGYGGGYNPVPPSPTDALRAAVGAARPIGGGYRPPNAVSPTPPVVTPPQPTMGAYHMHNYGPPLPAGTDPAIIAARQNQIARQAEAYAAQRFRQVAAIRHWLPPELQAAFDAASRRGAAGWRDFSGQFAAASRAAGYADPRYWLLRVLPAQAAAGQHGAQV